MAARLPLPGSSTTKGLCHCRSATQGNEAHLVSANTCRWKLQKQSSSSRQASTGVRRPPRAGADAGFVAEFELIPAPGLQTVSGDGDLRAGRLAHWPVGRAFGRCMGQASSLVLVLVLVLNEIPWRDRRWGLARLHVELAREFERIRPPRVLMARAEGLVRV